MTSFDDLMKLHDRCRDLNKRAERLSNIMGGMGFWARRWHLRRAQDLFTRLGEQFRTARKQFWNASDSNNAEMIKQFMKDNDAIRTDE